MYVSSFLEEIHIGLPTHHQIVIAGQCSYSAGVEFISITYHNIHHPASYHSGERYTRAVGRSYI